MSTTEGRVPSIVVTGSDLAAPAVKLLENFELVYAGKTPQEVDLIRLCELHDPVGIIVRYGAITSAVIAAAKSLRVISKHGSGTDTIDKAAAAQRGIAVVAALGANAAAVAEHAAALMLACAKSVPLLNKRMHEGHWDKATHKSIELSGKTIGLIGLGAIGTRFAKICAAMEMKVIAYDPYCAAFPEAVTAADLAAIWTQADVISLHCPLTNETRNLMNAQTLARCKPGVMIINTARGGLIDEAALLDAVVSGHVFAAGLDSFAVEPMAVPHPFHGVPGIVLSPHIGGVSRDAYTAMGVGAATNLLLEINR
jgi:D-3-phosphoglycerate dehydrogenase / 2-oxoglutarate reductase